MVGDVDEGADKVFEESHSVSDQSKRVKFSLVERVVQQCLSMDPRTLHQKRFLGTGHDENERERNKKCRSTTHTQPRASPPPPPRPGRHTSQRASSWDIDVDSNSTVPDGLQKTTLGTPFQESQAHMGSI